MSKSNVLSESIKAFNDGKKLMDSSWLYIKTNTYTDVKAKVYKATSTLSFDPENRLFGYKVEAPEAGHKVLFKSVSELDLRELSKKLNSFFKEVDGLEKEGVQK